MIYKVYSFKDSVVGQFMNPFYQHNDNVALRTLSQAVNDSKPNVVNQNAGDIQLYCLGEYNDITGEIKSEVRFVANAVDFVQKVGDDNA